MIGQMARLVKRQGKICYAPATGYGDGWQRGLGRGRAAPLRGAAFVLLLVHQGLGLYDAFAKECSRLYRIADDSLPLSQSLLP